MIPSISFLLLLVPFQETLGHATVKHEDPLYMNSTCIIPSEVGKPTTPPKIFQSKDGFRCFNYDGALNHNDLCLSETKKREGFTRTIIEFHKSQDEGLLDKFLNTLNAESCNVLQHLECRRVLSTSSSKWEYRCICGNVEKGDVTEGANMTKAVYDKKAKLCTLPVRQKCAYYEIPDSARRYNSSHHRDELTQRGVDVEVVKFADGRIQWDESHCGNHAHCNRFPRDAEVMAKIKANEKFSRARVLLGIGDKDEKDVQDYEYEYTSFCTCDPNHFEANSKDRKCQELNIEGWSWRQTYGFILMIFSFVVTFVIHIQHEDEYLFANEGHTRF